MDREVFKARVAELLEAIAGDEGRLWAALWAWWRRVGSLVDGEVDGGVGGHVGGGVEGDG